MKYSNNTLTLRSVTEKNSQQERPDTSKWFDYECNELKGDYLEDIK